MNSTQQGEDCDLEKGDISLQNPVNSATFQSYRTVHHGKFYSVTGGNWLVI